LSFDSHQKSTLENLKKLCLRKQTPTPSPQTTIANSFFLEEKLFSRTKVTMNKKPDLPI
jgi:hypothetical protein